MCTLPSDLSPDQILDRALSVAAPEAIAETIKELRVLDDRFSDLARVKANDAATKELRRDIAARLFARYLTITTAILGWPEIQLVLNELAFDTLQLYLRSARIVATPHLEGQDRISTSATQQLVLGLEWEVAAGPKPKRGSSGLFLVKSVKDAVS